MFFGLIPWRIRLKIMFAVLAVTFTIGGFNSLGDAMKYRHPIALTYSQFEQQHPSKGWFTITDATIDLTNGSPESSAARGYYVPLTVAGVDPKMMDTEVFIKDTDTVNKIDAINNSRNRPMTSYGMVHSSQLGPVPANTVMSGPVSGMISSDSDDSDFRVIKYGEKPSALKGIGMLIGGLIMCLGVLWSFGIQPSISGIKETVQAVRGGEFGYGQANPAPYGSNLPPQYPNTAWQQGQPQQYSNPYSQQPHQSNPYPAATPSNAWSPTGQSSPQYPQPGQPHAAPTPANAWSPTGQDGSAYPKPGQQYPADTSRNTWSPTGQNSPDQGQPQQGPQASPPQ